MEAEIRTVLMYVTIDAAVEEIVILGYNEEQT